MSIMSSEPVKAGYLKKCGKSVKSWNKRWFVLTPNGVLTYYEDSRCKVEKGMINITECKVCLHSEAPREILIKADKLQNVDDVNQAFLVVGFDRTYTCICESREECRSWMLAMGRIKHGPNYRLPESLSDTTAVGGAAQITLAVQGQVTASIQSQVTASIQGQVTSVQPQACIPQPQQSGPPMQSRPPMQSGPPMPQPRPPMPQGLPQGGYPPQGYAPQRPPTYTQAPPPRYPQPTMQPPPYYPPQQCNSYSGPPPPNKGSGYYQNQSLHMARPPPAPYQSNLYMPQARPPPPRPVVQQQNSVNVTVVNLAQPQPQIVYRRR